MKLFPLLIISFGVLGSLSWGATVLFQHEGANDPSTEGWSRITTGNSGAISEGAAFDSSIYGFDGWRISHLGSGSGDLDGGVYYLAALTSQQQLDMAQYGWKLSMRLRVADDPNAFVQGVSTIALVLNPYYLYVGSYEQFPRDTTIIINHDIFGVAGIGYHLYELSYDPATFQTSFMTDGVLRSVTGSAPPTLGSFYWGGLSGDVGVGVWNQISLSIPVPEPSVSTLIAVMAARLTFSASRWCPILSNAGIAHPQDAEPVPIWWTWIGQRQQPLKTMNEPKPKRVKKQYDEEFRRHAVALVEGSGRSLQEIAAELGVTHWNLRDLDQKAWAQPARARSDPRRVAA